MLKVTIADLLLNWFNIRGDVQRSTRLSVRSPKTNEN